MEIQTSLPALRNGVGILIHEPDDRRALEFASIRLGLAPLLLDDSSLDEGTTTLELLARLELIVADGSAMPRIHSIVSMLREGDYGVRPALVEVVAQDADIAEVLKEMDGVLVLPQEPASVVSQLSLILLTRRQLARRYEAALKELRLHRKIFESVSTGITVADATVPELPLIYVNPAFEAMTGYTFEEIQGNNCRFLQGSDREQPGIALIREALKEGRGVVTLLKNYKKDGTRFWNELSLSPVFDDGGGLTHFVGFQVDVTARVEAETALAESRKMLSEANAQLTQLSVTDSLTGLKNRRAFDEILNIAFSWARRTGKLFTVVLVDVDYFKKINDEYGHAAGDDVLREISGVLQSSLRLVDFAARFGGEEFVVLLAENAASAVTWSHRFYDLLSQTTWRYKAVTVSMGIAEVNPKVDDASTILWKADEALYRAKREGRARAITYSESV